MSRLLDHPVIKEGVKANADNRVNRKPLNYIRIPDVLIYCSTMDISNITRGGDVHFKIPLYSYLPIYFSDIVFFFSRIKSGVREPFGVGRI